MSFSVSLNRRLDFTDEENYEDFGEVDDIESDMSDPSQNRSVYQKDGQNFCNSVQTPSNSKVNITLLLFYKPKISVDYIKACFANFHPKPYLPMDDLSLIMANLIEKFRIAF